ncbi:MAG: glycosyltransferase family 4 protein, partial [Candidatus Helarchaeota archaeon]
MKIALCGTLPSSGETGGVSEYIMELAKRLSALDLEFEVLNQKTTDYKFDFKVKNFSKEIFFPSGISALVPMYRYLRRTHFDIIHAHTPTAGFITTLLRTKGKVKVIYTAHGFPTPQVESRFLSYLYTYYGYYLAAKACIHADERVTVCKFYQNYIKKNFQMNSTVIYNPVDRSQFSFRKESLISQIKKKYGVECIILFVGHLIKRKGVKYLIKAMKSIKNAVLFVVGDGYNRPLLEKLVNSYNLKNIYFLGFL